ncbi:MAG TPA: hypothetical protein VH394_02300 [Thermoanaerobaculia bacterium]|jgi:hypothetical protein|nr:hypothetical protein [Thermoanaerobaculia bacterium]
MERKKGFELVKGFAASSREPEKKPQRLRNVLVVEVRVKVQGPGGKPLFNLAEMIG